MKRLLLHGVLALLGVALAAPVLADGGRHFCGSEYWFEVDEPEGWKTSSTPSGDMLVLELLPEPEEADPALGMALMLILTGSAHRTDVVIDPENALTHWIGLLNAVAAPAEIRPFAVPTLELPHAGAQFEVEGGTLYVVVVDVHSGRGNYFVATLGKQGGEATTAELARFRATLGSIDFDPRRACGVDANRRAVTKVLPGPASDTAPGPAAGGQRFDLRKAGAGCSMLNELFVPVYCRMAELEGEATLLAFFDDDDGTESALTYLERFRERVATPFCFEAERHPDGAPQLVFHAENSPEAHVYACDTRRILRSVPSASIDSAPAGQERR